MSEAPRDESPTKPVPARALGSPAPNASRPGGGRHGRGSRDGSSAGFKPKPARESRDGQAGAAPTLDSDVDEVTFESDGASWIARLMGRSGSRGSPPLLLLRFRPAGADGNGPVPSEREAFVVGEALSSLTEHQLGDALARAVDARAADDEPRPFFADTGDARSR